MVAPSILAVLLALWNNLANLHPAFPRRYVPVNLLLAVALLAAARATGLSWDALGLAPALLGAGLAWGGMVAAGVALVLGVPFGVPALRPLLRDQRVAVLTGRQLAHLAAVRIPLGTVVLEEVAFRGVLLAAWARVEPDPVAVAVSSAAFGLWHVVPTLLLLRANRVGRVVPGIAAGVLATAAAGALLCALRLVSGSLLAPALVHLATNSLGALAAWRAQGGRPGVRN